MNELCLTRPDEVGVKLRIRLETTDVGCYNDGKSFPCTVVSTDSSGPCDASGAWAPLTPANARVDYLSFFASPSLSPIQINPATNDYFVNTAERATVVMGLHGLAPRVQDEWTLNLETTVTPRLYSR
jgi:hypothetical protein